jgi:DUF1680 family protein
VRLPADARVDARRRPDLFAGIQTLVAAGEALSAEGWEGELYRHTQGTWKPASLTLIPYHLWDNRTPGEMAVWLAER